MQLITNFIGDREGNHKVEENSAVLFMARIGQ